MHPEPGGTQHIPSHEVLLGVYYSVLMESRSMTLVMYVPHIYMHVSGKKAQSLTSGMYSKLLAVATFGQGMVLGGLVQIHCLSFKTQMSLCVVY